MLLEMLKMKRAFVIPEKRAKRVFDSDSLASKRLTSWMLCSRLEASELGGGASAVKYKQQIKYPVPP